MRRLKYIIAIAALIVSGEIGFSLYEKSVLKTRFEQATKDLAKARITTRVSHSSGRWIDVTIWRVMDASGKPEAAMMSGKDSEGATFTMYLQLAEPKKAAYRPKPLPPESKRIGDAVTILSGIWAKTLTEALTSKAKVEKTSEVIRITVPEALQADKVVPLFDPGLSVQQGSTLLEFDRATFRLKKFDIECRGAAAAVTMSVQSIEYDQDFWSALPAEIKSDWGK